MPTDDQLAALEARIAALEAAQMPAYTPLTGLKIAADGSSSFDFDGHVHAQGLDLDASVNETPPNDERVRWLNANGDPTGQIYTWQPAPGQPTLMVVGALPVDNAQARLLLSADNLDVDAGIHANVGAGPNSADAVIITAHGESTFLQLFGSQRLVLDGPHQTGTVAVGAGATVFPALAPIPAGFGFTRVGVLITDVGASTHWQVSFNPSGTAGVLAFTNFGAAQGMAATYYQLLT